MSEEVSFSFEKDVFIGGRYQVKSQLAVGGLGEIYSCFDTRTRHNVALKRFKTDSSIPKEVLAQNAQEALALSSLRHPNIVSLLDVGIDELGLFLVMELIDGETLTEVIARKPLDVDAFISFARQALEGLSAAHRKGILHLDIKPSNIMITPTANKSIRVKIVDFGLAQFVQKKNAEASSDGSILGSVFYISPEILLRQHPDPRSDLYSLGQVFYFALVGQPAFFSDDVQAVVEAHVHTPPAPLETLRPDCGLELCSWVHQFIEKDPENRHSSAQNALHKLTTLSLSYHKPHAAKEDSSAASSKKTTSFIDAPTKIFSLFRRKV